MKLKLFATILLALSVVSCGGVNGPSSNTNQNFDVTVQPGGQATVSFTAGKASQEYSVFVSTVTPAPPAGIGVALGQVVGGACSIYQPGYFTEFGHTTLSGYIQPGAWCVILFDPYGTYTSVPFQAPIRIVGYVSHP